MQELNVDEYALKKYDKLNSSRQNVLENNCR